jgi:hypothetical protein
MSFLQHFSILIGLSATLIGLLAMLKPKFMSEGFGIKVEGDALSYVVALGVRDIFIGLSVLALYVYKLWFMIGILSLLISLVALTDFLVVFKFGVKKTSILHLLGFFASLVYGVTMILSHS